MAFPVEPEADIRAVRLTLRVLFHEQGPELRHDRNFSPFVVLGFSGTQLDETAKKSDLAPIEPENFTRQLR
jgi:hypothetical protein